MSKVFVYDPPMCCSTGVCGPNPDPVLITFQDTIDKLKSEGIEIERYLITQSPEKFKENKEILRLIQEEQLKVLPITLYEDKILFKGKYPSYDELKLSITEDENEN